MNLFSKKTQNIGGSDNVSHLHMLTTKDMQNIARDFNISKGVVFHKNDADSVAAWVDKNRMEDGGNSMVRYVKFQGEVDTKGLQSVDFMLVIMSSSQIAGIHKFCGPNKEVALDSTHGTNAYDFQLTTLMAIDDHGEGYACAICYSNRIDEVAMRIFLSVVKDTVGKKLTDVILMTDDAEVYSNAWNKVMGPPGYRLLCIWHVLRSWHRNLKKISGIWN